MPANYMAKFEVGDSALPVRILRLEQRLSAALADHVFCADHNQKDFLVDNCGIATEKVTVLMNLPNVQIFHPVERQICTGAFRIVYHGTLAHRLGIDLILKAMARVVEHVPAELWIYGAGDFLSEALTLSSQLNLDGKVHFSRSFFPVEDIPKIVSGMDLGVIGNRRNLACDRFMVPVKLLEYVYLGVPVVAPRLGAITRYFDETMIRFYEPENVEQMAAAIVALFHDTQERERQGRAASRFYDEYRINEQAQQYLHLVGASVAMPGSRPATVADRHGHERLHIRR
jgi:glycosyltransferase involved in cell wall biosynthesis